MAANEIADTSRRGEPPRPLSRRKKLLYSSALLVLALGITEIGWRVYAWRQYERKLAEYESGSWVEDRRLGHLNKPGPQQAQAPGEDPVRFNINSLHLRGPEVLDPAPRGLIRILCLGGSTTFGTWCKSDATTYPGQLQTMLEAGDPDQPYEVLNGGVPMYRTTESYHNLNRLRALSPDIVLVYHAINDIIWGVDEFYLDPTNAPRPESRLGKRRREASSFFFQALLHRLFDRRPENPEGRTEIDPKLVAAFADNLRRIGKLAVEIGAIPVFITFDARLELDFPAPVRAEIEAQIPFRQTHMTYDGLVRALARYNDRIRAVAREFGRDAIELEGRVPDDPEYWPDFVHLTDEGTRRKTEIVYRQLLPTVAEAKRRRGKR